MSTSRLAALVAIAGGLLLGVVASEAMLRLLAPVPDRYLLYKPHLSLTFEIPDGELPGVRGPAHFVMNSLGLRSDELPPEAGFRILAIGGSTTLDAYLDHDEIWTQRLQQRLNEAQDGARVWVGNAGKSAHRTREHRLQARQLLDDLPPMDMVILVLGANDMLRRLAEDRSYDPHFFERPDAEAELAQRAFEYTPLHLRLSQPFWKRTQLYARMHQLYLVGMRLAEGRARGTIEDVQGINLRSWRENRRAALAIRDTLPDLGPALEEYAENLVHLAETVRAHGAEPIFATQPSMWRTGLPDSLVRLLWLGGVGDYQRPGARSEYYAIPALAEAMDRYNQTLLGVCRRLALRCIDLAPQLPKDDGVFYDDAHFNEAGADRVAAVFAAALLPQIRAKAQAGR